MKIVIDARLYGLENAGLGRYVMNLVKYLALSDTTNQYCLLLRKQHFSALELPSNWKKVLADFQHYSLKEQIILPLILLRERPSLVHFPHFNVPLLYFGKFVVTIHDLIMHQFTDETVTTRSPLVYRLKRWGYNLVFAKAVKRSCKIIVPSKEVKNNVQTSYPDVNPDKIISLYEGCDTVLLPNIDLQVTLNKYHLSLPYLVYYGNAYPHKNVEFLLEAIKLVNQKGRKLALFISSPRSVFAEKLKQQIIEKQLNGTVIIQENVSDEDIAAILTGSVGFCYPSLLEGFGLQGLEVMSSGALLLASDTPVFKEVYQDKAIYFDPKDVNSLVGVIERVLAMGENEKEEWIRQGKEFVKRYSWSKMAQETLGVYEKSGHSV